MKCCPTCGSQNLARGKFVPGGSEDEVLCLACHNWFWPEELVEWTP